MKVLRFFCVILLVIFVTSAAVACAQATPTPTLAPTTPAKTTPALVPTTPAAWQPVYKNGVLQPLPDGFPDGPITIWSEFGPGHAMDIYARTMAAAAKDLTPVLLPVQVAGTSTSPTFGMLNKMKALPRYEAGYHVVSTSLASMGVHYWTTQRGGFTLDDTKPFIATKVDPIFIASRADAPWKTFQELISYSKANPGKVRYGIATGTKGHIQWVSLARAARVDWLHVPHTSNPAAILTLLGGGIELVATNYAALKPHVDKGEMRILAIYGSQRDKVLPDVPAVSELGIDITTGDTLTGLWTYGGVPETHVRWLYELFKKASEQPAYQEKNKAGYAVRDAEYLVAAIKKMSDTFGPIIKELGLAVEQKK